MISKTDLVDHYVDPERKALISRSGFHVFDINAAFANFKTILSSWSLDGIGQSRDLLSLCDHLDHQLNVPAPLAAVVTELRRTIGKKILEDLAARKRSQSECLQITESEAISLERDVSELILTLIEEVHSQLGPTDIFTPSWIALNTHNGLYGKFLSLIRDPKTHMSNWQFVKDLLPPSIRDLFNIDKTIPTETKLVDVIRRHREIAEKLGPEALAEFLISTRDDRTTSFPRLVKIIAQYLGRCNIRTITPVDVPLLPPALLQITGIERLVQIQLRNYFYHEMVSAVPVSSDPQTYQRIFDKIMGKIVKKGLDLSDPVHQKIFDDLIQYFHSIFAIEPSSRMPQTIRTKNGEISSFPSLRQRIAMKELEHGRRKLVAFFMGDGKTATSFLCKEHVSAKKMLYICPTDLVPQTADRVSKYYTPESMPSVGIIRAGITEDALQEALQKEVVICPYSMFRSKRGDRNITDAIKQAGFDFVTVDEVHNAKKDGRLYTETIFDFINEIPGLYERGHMLLLSGDPVPNSPKDILAQLRLYDRETYGNLRGLKSLIKRVDPLHLRNALLDFMLLIDPPEQWERFVRFENFDLYESERSLYQGIWYNEDLTPQEKRDMLSLSILNPDLFSETDVQSSLFDQCTAVTRRYLQDYDCVVIGENNYKFGITRPHSRYRQTACFADKIRQEFASEADVYIIDGDTDEEERVRIMEQSKKKGTRKMILVVRTGLIREGHDLSHIHRAVVLEPTYNKADMAQLVKRFNREGNTDVAVTVLLPSDTLFQGFEEHAAQKAVLTHRLKHGGTLTLEDEQMLCGGDFAEDLRIINGRVWIGTPLMDYLLTSKQKLSRIFSYLHGKGAEAYQEFLTLFGETFAELYLENFERSYSGNNNRFIAGLLKTMEKKEEIPGQMYADVGCGPLALANTLSCDEDWEKRTLRNYDINPHLLEAGRRYFKGRHGSRFPEPFTDMCNMCDMRQTIRDGQFHMVNSSLTLNYTKLNVLRTHPEKDERVQALCELNRILEDQGILVLTLPEHACSRIEFLNFAHQMRHFGFEVLDQYSGEGSSVDNAQEERRPVFRNYTLVCRKNGVPHLEDIDLRNFKLSRVSRPRTTKEGGVTKSDIPNPYGTLHTQFQLKNLTFSYSKNSKQALQNIENHRQKMEEARALLLDIYKEYGTLDNLPEETKSLLSTRGIRLFKLRLGKQGTRNEWIFSLAEKPDESEQVFP